MRIGVRRLVAAFLLVALLALGAVALVRWRAAGVPRAITPPAGAVTPPSTEKDVLDRASIVERGLRSDRGEPVVRAYALPPGSPWLQSRQIVATQLDHWQQIGDCADRPEASIVECAWREPTRWWPREVVLTMVRLAPATDARSRPTFVVIGSGVGDRLR